MKCLLDTHVLLWTPFDAEQLSSKAAEKISSPQNQIYASIVSYWEISLKYSIGKLELRGISPEELPAASLRSGIHTLNITGQIAASFHHLPRRKHKDPFDRLITQVSHSH